MANFDSPVAPTDAVMMAAAQLHNVSAELLPPAPAGAEPLTVRKIVARSLFGELDAQNVDGVSLAAVADAALWAVSRLSSHSPAPD